MRQPRRNWLIGVLSLTLLAGCSVQAEAPEETSGADEAGSKEQHTNRLADETSPYLLLHAHNPVDWHPWGPEAFEKAKKEGKPIFLSIGYSSCYWCHVMERKVFSNEKIAKYMNEHFINIKVDREERPDVDDIYMTAVQVYFQLIGAPQAGGWPLSIFLTPEGKPIAGGSYFPPTNENGRIGFDSVMSSIHDAWENNREKVEENAEVLTTNLQRVMKPRLNLKPAPLERKLVEQTVSALKDSYDEVHGGVDFNPAAPHQPKFPVPVKLSLLEYQARFHEDNRAAKIVDHTLEALAAGGIRDHLAGGFHRYSTDRRWLVPHFEKMLYDNAQLAGLYARAYARTGKEAYRTIAEEILRYVSEEMTHKGGAFYSAQDAETDAVEGKYYVWSAEKVENVLGGEDAKLFTSVYGFDEEVGFEHGHILHLPKSLDEVAKARKTTPAKLAERLAPLRQKLLAARRERKAPLTDDKILTSWNGLMITAYADAGRIFERPEYVESAAKAARFLLENLRNEKGELLRTYRKGQAKLNAYLDDYAFLVEGLIALHLATDEQEWLDLAVELTEKQIEGYWDEKLGGFYFTSDDHEVLLVRTKNAYDSVIPSGNSVSARNLLRLASLTGEEKYRKRAEELLQAFAAQIPESSTQMANTALALAEFLDKREFRPGITPTSLRQEQSSEAVALAEQNGDEKKKKKEEPIVKPGVYLSVKRLPAGRTCELAMIVKIKKGWHINTNPAKPDFLIPTKIEIKSKQGVKLKNVRYPKGKKLEVAGAKKPYHVYEKQVVLRGSLEVPKKSGGKTDELTVTLHYQACNERQCLRPEKTALRAKLKIAPAGEAVEEVNGKLFGEEEKKPKK